LDVQSTRRREIEHTVVDDRELNVVVEASVGSAALVDVPPSSINNNGVSGNALTFDKPGEPLIDVKIAVRDRSIPITLATKNHIWQKK
jgi:hypothetical protein